MRGKDDRPCAYDHTDRITPAYAGKSTRLSLFAIFSGDHPRVCGEKHPAFSVRHIFRGSPPRVRGKGSAPPRGHPLPGITPACAGKSPRALTRRIMTGDHPRVCGEKNADLLRSRILRGSPPRVRGKVVVQQGNPSTSGITPACAGKSCCPALF